MEKKKYIIELSDNATTVITLFQKAKTISTSIFQVVPLKKA